MEYVRFTEEMKKDYTILAPNMLPSHFKMYLEIMKTYGYKVELLETTGHHIAECGLKYVHNDTCYPAIVVIGQFLDAIQSGKYDTKKLALIMFQTGGGCRASNYISLIRKALARAGYGYIPVISINFQGLEDHPGFKLTVPFLYKLLYATLYGDLILLLENQCKPYEVIPGETSRITNRLTKELMQELSNGKFNISRAKKTYKKILDAYSSIERKQENKVKVGIVGEIFVKFSPTGNNNLEKFLVEEGAEVVIPGFLDFLIYCFFNNIMDYKLYRRSAKTYPAMVLVYKILTKMQKIMIEEVKKDGRFRPPTPFNHTKDLAAAYINYGCKMGEGWLLPAEMLELADSGVKNIVCTQPFGCLPNHIVGKGVMNPINKNNPDVNIIAVDYDASASEINQHNRIKLMLANAKEALKENKEPKTEKQEILV